MNTNVHNGGHGNGKEPFHDSVTFEPRDINVATVVKQLVYLAITIVLALVICVPILKVLTNRSAEADTPIPPVRAEMSQADRDETAMPPEPRLQGVPGHVEDAQQDLRDKIAADIEANESYGWVDKANGVAKIPVSEAMKLIAEKSGTQAAASSAAQEKKQ